MYLRFYRRLTGLSPNPFKRAAQYGVFQLQLAFEQVLATFGGLLLLVGLLWLFVFWLAFLLSGGVYSAVAFGALWLAVKGGGFNGFRTNA